MGHNNNINGHQAFFAILRADDIPGL
jgi:hypothetical protein